MKKFTPIRKIVMWVVFVIFAIYAFTLVFPFVWMLINSLKTNSEFFQGDIWSLPKKITFENFIGAFNNYSIYRQGREYGLFSMFLTSIIITVSATIINTVLSTMTAYVIAKYNFFGKKVIYSIAIFTMIMPIVGTLPTQYQLMKNLHLINSIPGILVLYSGCFGFTFFIMHGYFSSVSWTYAEAAFIDGASDFQVFWHVMLPMARPIMVSLGIIYAIGIWNDYVTPSIYLQDMPTLSVGLRTLSQLMISNGAYSEMFAAMIIAILPILIVFVVFQKTIMENTLAGGIKG
jgi:raffinose/stachyose/melibiose transport system permease protein/N-acetylglucosamine transport system permease protein